MKVNKGIRVANGIIDFLIVTIVSSFLYLFTWTFLDIRLQTFLMLFLYYLLFETICGQTLGKMATGTIVVTYSYKKPGFWRILLRTILRINPYDWMSYMFGKEQGGHDVLSRTMLVDEDEMIRRRIRSEIRTDN